MTGFRTVLLLLLVADAACSTEFSPQPCSVDGDCGNGLVCEIRDRAQTCVAAEDATLRIGQSAPQSGANQALGTNMKLGIDLAFAEQNTKGGIRGRTLALVSRDDGYSPDLAEMNSRTLLDVQVASTQTPKCPSTSAAIADALPVSTTALSRGPNAVLAILGNVGTPTMVRSAPIAIETSTVFFGAFTGGRRDPALHRAADPAPAGLLGGEHAVVLLDQLLAERAQPHRDLGERRRPDDVGERVLHVGGGQPALVDVDGEPGGQDRLEREQLAPAIGA